MNTILKHAVERSYTITPLPSSAGCGWMLRVFVAGEEVGFREFPARAADCTECLRWWDGLTNDERTVYAQHASSATEAHRRHLLDVAYADAETTACAWMEARALSLSA